MTKKNYTYSKYSQFFAICKAHGFDYKEKVYEFTEGRTDSLSSLTDLEYTQMMKRLIELNEPMRKATKFEKQPGDAQRKKLIALALLMKWGDMKQALARLDGWCKKQKYKKGLMQHNEQELSLLVSIFEQRVYPDYLVGLNK
jgi:hypothetical protein